MDLGVILALLSASGYQRREFSKYSSEIANVKARMTPRSLVRYSMAKGTRVAFINRLNRKPVLTKSN